MADVSRLVRHLALLGSAGALATACSLNPRPDDPGFDSRNNGNGAGGDVFSGAGGSSNFGGQGGGGGNADGAGGTSGIGNGGTANGGEGGGSPNADGGYIPPPSDAGVHHDGGPITGFSDAGTADGGGISPADSGPADGATTTGDH